MKNKNSIADEQLKKGSVIEWCNPFDNRLQGINIPTPQMTATER